MENIYFISIISITIISYSVYKFFDIKNKNVYLLDLSQKFATSSNIEDIATILISELKKHLKAANILFNQYTFSDTKTLAQIPQNDIQEIQNFPSRQFLILKEILENNTKTFLFNKDFEKGIILEYFNKFRNGNFILIPIFADNYKIITVEVIYENPAAKLFDYDFIQKIIEIFNNNYIKLDNFLEKQEELKKEELVSKVLDKIKNIFDERTMMYTILQEVATAFEADRCYFIEYDKNNINIPRLLSEYTYSPYTKSIMAKDLDYKTLWEFFKSIKMTDADYMFERVDEFIKSNNLQNTPIEQFLKASEIKSSYPFKILDNEKSTLYLIVQYTQMIGILKKEDLKKIELLIKQIKVAIYQAQLYTKLQNNSEREKLMIDLIGILRSSLDINVVINDFISKIGHYFNATRCIVRKFDENTKKFSVFDEAYEYKKNFYTLETKNSILSNEMENFLLHNEKFHDVLNIKYKGEFFEDDFEYKDIVMQYFEYYKINSFLAAFVRHNNKLCGVISMHFSEDVDFTKHDEEFIKAIAYQVGAALYQSNLYTSVIKKAEKEKLLKNILNDVRSIQEKNSLLNYFVQKFAYVFSAFGVIIFEKNNEFLYFDTKPNNQEFVIKEVRNLLFKMDEEYELFDNKYFELDNDIKNIFLLKTEINMDLAFIFDKEITLKDIDMTLVNSIIELVGNTLNLFENNEKIINLRETFLSTLSHDLQIPLIAERNALEFIIKKLESDEKFDFKEIISEILDTNIDMTEMLKNLLEIYKIEAKKVSFDKKEHNILKILDEAEYETDEFLKKKHITLEKNILTNNFFILCDELALKRAIKILIKNAANNIKLERIINITITKENEKMIICISIEGSNMSKEVEKIIFERNSMSKYLQREIGAGLPVYLAKLLVEGQNGQLFVKHYNESDLTFCIAI